jgi:hypothetical protein
MPRATFQKALIAAQKSFGIMKNIGIVWVSNAGYSRSDLSRIADYLSNIYAVSPASVRVRLNTLELIYDEAAVRTRSMNDVLNSENFLSSGASRDSC